MKTEPDKKSHESLNKLCAKKHFGKRFLVTHMIKSCKGAVTVEYALIFPVVIVCVMMLIYIGLVYYQQALLQSVVSENSQNYALLWGYDFSELNTREGITSIKTYRSEGLYWHVFPSVEKKKMILQDNVRNEISKRSILMPSREVEVEVVYQNYFFVQKVGIKADMAYKLPVYGLLKSLGLSGDIQICAYSEIAAHDPKEFIHNVDYSLQIFEESGASDWIKEKCKPLINALNKIKTFFN